MAATTTTTPAAAPAPLSSPSPPPSPSPRRWRWLQRVVLFVLLGTLGWVVFYAASRGFTRRWRSALQEEFRRHGLDISVRRITLDPFEGLVADGVRLRRLDPRRTRILSIRRAALDVDFKRLLRKRQAFLRSVDLRGTRLDLPTDPADRQSPTVRLRRLGAKIYFLSDRIQVAQVEGEWAGIRLSASGEILHPERLESVFGGDRPDGDRGAPAGTTALPPSAASDEEQRAARRARTQRVLLAARQLHFEGETPRVSVRFHADLARPLAEARAGAEVRAARVRLRPGGYQFDGLRARLDWSDGGVLRLREAELTDARGRLTLAADYAPADGQARWTAEGGLDLLAVWRHLRGESSGSGGGGGASGEAKHAASPATALAADEPDPLAGLILRDPPRLRVEGRARLPGGEDFQLTGHVGLGRTEFRGVSVERLETDFSWRPDGTWFLRDLKLTGAATADRNNNNVPAPNVAGDVLRADGQLRVRLAGMFGPATVLPLLPARVRNALREWEFSDPPRLEINASAPLLPPGAAGGGGGDGGGPDWSRLRAEGKVALGRTRFRGVGLNRLTGDYAYGGGTLTCRNLQVDRDEGGMRADACTYEVSRREVRVENLRANVFPAEVAVWVDADLTKNLRPFRFPKPPAATANGVVQFGEGATNSRFTVDFTAPAGMNYTFARRDLRFPNVAGRLVFTDPKLFLQGIRAGLLGGEVRGNLELAIGKGVPSDYRADLDLRDVDFAPLTKLYFDYDESRGRLFGTYRWTGRGDDPGTMRGTGSLRVERGNVLALPLFGPLSGPLDIALPGVGQPVAHLATADFLVNGGKIYNGNLQVKGPGLSMLGGGWLGFTDDSMNYRLRINAQGLIGTILYPVSKLFEYGSQGPLHKPVWRPRALGGGGGAPGNNDNNPPPSPAAPAATTEAKREPESSEERRTENR